MVNKVGHETARRGRARSRVASSAINAHDREGRKGGGEGEHHVTETRSARRHMTLRSRRCSETVAWLAALAGVALRGENCEAGSRVSQSPPPEP